MSRILAIERGWPVVKTFLGPRRTPNDSNDLLQTEADLTSSKVRHDN
jgi:hypothetical protein